MVHIVNVLGGYRTAGNMMFCGNHSADVHHEFTKGEERRFHWQHHYGIFMMVNRLWKIRTLLW